MYSDFETLKIFLLVLSQSGFGKSGLPNNVPVRGKLVPINSCFDVLRKFLPAEIKEKSNKDILEYLRKDPRNAERLVATHFRPEEAQELMKSLEEKPVAIEEVSGQAAPSSQGLPPTGATPGGAPLGGMGLPTAPSVSTPRIRFKKEIPQAPEAVSTGTENTPFATASTPTTTPTVSATSNTPTAAYSMSSSSVNLPHQTASSSFSPTQTQSATASPRRFNFSSFRSSAGSAFKKMQNFASPAGQFFQRNIGKHLTGTNAMNLLGKAGRTGMDALSGINNFGGGNGNGRRLSDRFRKGRRRARSFVGNVKKRGKWVAALSIIVPMTLVGVLVLSAPTATPGQATPLPTSTPTPAPNATLSSCKFTRAGLSTQFQSPLLLSFIQEASQKSSIPAVALAAFIRVESPSSSNMSNDQISNYSANCAESPTKALGIMQIQPPGTISLRGDPASCDDCIDAGAKLVGKTVSTMTRQDYCDPRTNIIVGAGWILKKMSKLGYGDGTKWDPAWTNDRKIIEALVNTYYGCLIYGGATDCTGSYNYADDVSTSISQCKSADGTTPAPPGPIGISLTCPVGNPTVTCGTAANPVNNCGHGDSKYNNGAKCNPTFYVCNGDRYSDALYYAIDVAGNNGNKVRLPFVNGNESVVWTRIEDDPIPIGGGIWGYRVDYTAKDKSGRELVLDLTHLNNQTPPLTVIKSGTPTEKSLIPGLTLVDLNYLINPAKTLNSGDQVGTYFTDPKINHLHIGLTVDGKFVEPIQQANMCI